MRGLLPQPDFQNFFRTSRTAISVPPHVTVELFGIIFEFVYLVALADLESAIGANRIIFQFVVHRGAPPPAHSSGLLQNVLDFPQHATYYSAVITKSSKITKNNPDTETYHFRLPKELMQTINRWAERENRTASLQVKEILSRGIRQWYKEQV